MKFPPSTALVAGLTFLAFAGPCEGGPEPLTNGISPDGRFEVLLEAEKGTPEFEKYEMQGEPDQFPAFLLRDAKLHKVLNRTEWPGDPISDAQPLATHSKISWSPASSAVSIDTTERFYSFTTILALNPKTGRFVEVKFPSYETLTGHKAPEEKDLRPRGHSWVERWTADGKLIWRMLLSPAGAYQGDDPMDYRITLSITAKGMKVVSHEALKREDR